jgi:hypothetical protein
MSDVKSLDAREIKMTVAHLCERILSTIRDTCKGFWKKAKSKS